MDWKQYGSEVLGFREPYSESEVVEQIEIIESLKHNRKPAPKELSGADLLALGNK